MRILRVVPPGAGQAALTHYQVIERREDSALLELCPVTGRTNLPRANMRTFPASV